MEQKVNGLFKNLTFCLLKIQTKNKIVCYYMRNEMKGKYYG